MQTEQFEQNAACTGFSGNLLPAKTANPCRKTAHLEQQPVYCQQAPVI